jgi:hypothetical protein
VASLSVARESIDFGWIRGLWRRFAVAGLAILVLAVGMSTIVAGEFATLMMVWFLPLLATLGIPATLFLAIAWRPTGRSVPSLGACWLAGVAAVVLVQILTVVGVELYFSGLETASARTAPWRVPSFLLAVIALGSFAGSVAAVAASLAKRSGLQSLWWLVGIPVISLLVPTGVQVAIRLALSYAGFSEYRAYTDVAVFCALIGAVLVLAAKVGRTPAAPEGKTT